MKAQSLQDLLIEELRDLYSAESQLLKALPRMARAATDPGLRAGFEAHLEQTRGQKERLEQIFAGLGLKIRAKTCEGIKGIIEEGEAQLKMDADDATMDAMLIATAQKAEHYEIASYGAVAGWARTLGLADAARLLEQTLAEERQTDAKLTGLATANVNAMAEAGEDADEDEEDGDLEEAQGRRRGAHVLSSTGEDDEEGDQEREEIETAMAEDEEDAAHEISLGRENRRRADAPPSTRRRGGNRQRSNS